MCQRGRELVNGCSHNLSFVPYEQKGACNWILESHIVNFVLLVGLYYERCFLKREISIVMLLSEGSFDTFCANVVSDCLWVTYAGVACSEYEVLVLDAPPPLCAMDIIDSLILKSHRRPSNFLS